MPCRAAPAKSASSAADHQRNRSELRRLRVQAQSARQCLINYQRAIVGRIHWRACSSHACGRHRIISQPRQRRLAPSMRHFACEHAGNRLTSRNLIASSRSRESSSPKRVAPKRSISGGVKWRRIMRLGSIKRSIFLHIIGRKRAAIIRVQSHVCVT